MGWFDGFPFKSKEQREKERIKFQTKVLPFGEPQKKAALLVLKQLAGTKLQDEELLFAFFSAKDKYISGLEDDEALEAAAAAIKKHPRLTPADKQNVVALVHLEYGIESLDNYPTPQQVLQAAEQLK
ncbi:hypothetical protein LJC61_04285 [Ruminococcaceae bacterium OttesenSCG-928-A16]|nr:hypothetical protein [Ruminococcaceae bacterium OttesenSCG-928-A16]